MQRSSMPAGTSHPFARRLIGFFGSKVFFGLIVALFVLQASWIALTARYPQAFDEQFHFGLIQIYSHHLSPFLAGQPPHAEQYGAVARDPSFLYHYLMSFPYRLIAHLSASQTTQIIILRLMNVAMLASSLFVFKRLLRFARLSNAMSNVFLGYLVLLPVFPLLGAQISYDNAFIPLSALACLWAAEFVQKLLQRRIWDWPHALRLLALCLFVSVIKYPFLPIFGGIVLVSAIVWWRVRSQRMTVKSGSRWALVGWSLAVLVGALLVFQRDGINTIKYFTPIPECNQVLSISECKEYGPWARNYNIAQTPVHPPLHQDLVFPFVWIYHMLDELVFTISSSFNDDGSLSYHTGSQLISIEVSVWAMFGLAVGVVVLAGRALWRDQTVRTFGILAGAYLLALFLQNLRDYMHLGQPLAIHGRYLFPIMPLLMGIIGIAAAQLAHRRHRRARITLRTKAALASVLLLVSLLQGGGFVTYILRSDPGWFWPQSSPAQTLNAKAKQVLKPVVLDTEKN